MHSLPAELPGSPFLYLEKSKDCNKKLLELVNKFHEVAGYKINVQKSVAFLFTNKELSETLRKSCFQLHQRIKHLGINLTKKVRDLCIETEKTLMKEMEEDTNKCKDIACLCVGKIATVQVSILPKAMLQIQCSLSQNSSGNFHRNRRNNPKICAEPQKSPNSKSSLEKEVQSWE